MRSPMRSPTRSPTPLPKWRPSRTLIDLYNEKDRTKWYWKASATMSASMIMIAFLIFPSSFNDQSDLTVSKISAGVVAGVLLALGFIVSIALPFICKSWLFQLETLYLPCLLSCLFGLFNVIYSLSIRSGPLAPQSHWNAFSIAAITLSTISALAYTVFYLLTYRKVYIVRSRDAMHRHNTDGESLLPEDEMQRQQLLRLLLQRDGKKVSSELSRSTYRIDLPNEMRRSSTTHLSAPQNVYGRDGHEPRENFSRSRSVPNVPLLDPSIYPILHHTEPPTVQIQEPTEPPNPIFPQFTHPPPPEPSFPQYPEPLLPSEQYHPHANDLGIEGIVNTHPRKGSFPIEKQEQLTRELSMRHPAERPDYHIVDSPIVQPSSPLSFRQQSVEELNRLSRESRRVEIEMEDRGRGRERGKEKRAELEVEGVEITPRIVRVGTDGWGAG